MTITLNKINNNNNINYRVCDSACLYVRWRGVTLKTPGDGDFLRLSIGWLWDPPESQPLEILQGTGKDEGGCYGGGCDGG